MTSGPDVPRALPYRLQRRNGLNILDRTLGDDDRTARAVRLMKPVLLTIVIVAVSFAIIAVAAGGAAASLAALTTLVCTGTGTALYRRLALRPPPEPEEVPPRPPISLAPKAGDREGSTGCHILPSLCPVQPRPCLWTANPETCPPGEDTFGSF